MRAAVAFYDLHVSSALCSAVSSHGAGQRGAHHEHLAFYGAIGAFGGKIGGASKPILRCGIVLGIGGACCGH